MDVDNSVSSGKGKGSPSPRDGCFKCGGTHFQRDCGARKGTGKQSHGKGKQSKSWSKSEPSFSGKGKSQENKGKSKGQSKGTKTFNFAFFSINDTTNNCPFSFSDVDVVAADAACNTVISVVVFLKETTNSVATVSGLCPLLHQQEFPSRPQGRAIGLDDAVSEVYDTAP